MASAQQPVETVHHFIDGQSRRPSLDDTLDVVNPSTGKLLLTIPAGSDEDVDGAVAAARTAFDDGRWTGLPPSARKAILHRFADLIANDAAELDALDASEMGKPVSLHRFSAASAADFTRFNAEAVDKLDGAMLPSDTSSVALQRLVPRGVVGAVVPWNFPTFNALLKVAPALTVGNSVVLKPSEHSSRSALRLAERAMEAGMPAGVFNVVLGSGAVAGRALGLHCDVDMLTFTGSTAVGKTMLGYAGASNMKVVQAECGGKSPHILFADCPDLDAVSDFIADFITANQGQICSIGSRLLVEKSIEQRVVDRIAKRLSAVVVGNALDRDTSFGPLVSARQRDRVLGYMASAAEDGAELVVGGGSALAADDGFYVRPTVYRSVRPDARIAQEEIFGPVLAVTTFETIEEAVRLANGTIYGLAAYVWTADLSKAMRTAKEVRANVSVFSGLPTGEGAGHATSWEPAGQSGFGCEGGVAGLAHYSRRQSITIFHN